MTHSSPKRPHLWFRSRPLQHCATATDAELRMWLVFLPSDDRTVDRVFTALLFSLPSSGRGKTASGVPIDRESSDCRTAERLHFLKLAMFVRQARRWARLHRRRRAHDPILVVLALTVESTDQDSRLEWKPSRDSETFPAERGGMLTEIHAPVASPGWRSTCCSCSTS